MNAVKNDSKWQISHQEVESSNEKLLQNSKGNKC
jgi:hypothetical protein